MATVLPKSSTKNWLSEKLLPQRVAGFLSIAAAADKSPRSAELAVACTATSSSSAVAALACAVTASAAWFASATPGCVPSPPPHPAASRAKACAATAQRCLRNTEYIMGNPSLSVFLNTAPAHQAPRHAPCWCSPMRGLGAPRLQQCSPLKTAGFCKQPARLVRATPLALPRPFGGSPAVRGLHATNAVPSINCYYFYSF